MTKIYEFASVTCLKLFLKQLRFAYEQERNGGYEVDIFASKLHV
jgi:hypothetical protein